MGALSHVNTELESAKTIGAGSGVLTTVKGDHERKALASKIAKAVLTFQILCPARFPSMPFRESLVLLIA